MKKMSDPLARVRRRPKDRRIKFGKTGSSATISSIHARDKKFAGP